MTANKTTSPRDLQSRYQSELVQFNEIIDQLRELESKKEKFRSIPVIARHLHVLANTSKCPPPSTSSRSDLTVNWTPTSRITMPLPESAVGKGLSAIKALDKKTREATVLLNQSRGKLDLMEVEATTQGVELPPMQVPGQKENTKPEPGSKDSPAKTQEAKSPPSPDLQKAPESEEEQRGKQPAKEDSKAALNAGNRKEAESLKGSVGIRSFPKGKSQGTPPENWDNEDVYACGHTISDAARIWTVARSTACRWIKDKNVKLLPTGRVPIAEIKRLKEGGNSVSK